MTTETNVQSNDFITIGLEKTKNTIIQTFKGTNIYLIIFLILLFLGVAFYVYTTYMSPMFENDYIANNENKTDNGKPTPSFDNVDNCDDEDEVVINNKESSKMTMYLIYTSWCPYSQKALKEWNKLKGYYNSTMKGKYNIELKEIDGDNKDEIKKFTKDTLNKNIDKKSDKKWKEKWREIEGYPTIYLIKNDIIYEYEATPKKDTLVEFITQVDLE